MTINKKEDNAAQKTVQEWVIVCPVCQIDVDGYNTPAEADYLAGIHNDLHHGSRPDAYTVSIQEPAQKSRQESMAGLGGAA